jgi:hypothetical protein
MRKKAKKRFSPKICACGCGETFTPIREWQIYKNDKHRKRAWMDRASIDVESAIKKLEARILKLEKHFGIGDVK